MSDSMEGGLSSGVEHLGQTQEKYGQPLEEDVLLRQKLAQNTRDISQLMAKYDTHRMILAGIVSKVDSLPDLDKYITIQQNVEQTGNMNKQLEHQINELKDEIRTMKITVDEKDVSNRNWTSCLESDVKEKVTFLDSRIDKTVKSLIQLRSEWNQWKSNNFCCPEELLLPYNLETQKENISPGRGKRRNSSKSEEFPLLEETLQLSLKQNTSTSQSSISQTKPIPKEFVPKTNTKISSIAESLIKGTKQKSTPSFYDISPTNNSKLKPNAPEFISESLTKDTKPLHKSNPSFYDISPTNNTNLKPSAAEFIPGSTNAQVQEEQPTRVRRNTTGPITNLRPAMSQTAVSLPAVSLPAVSQTAVSQTAVSLPALSLPAVSLPAVSLPAVSQTAVRLPAVSQPAVSQPFDFTGTPNLLNMVPRMPTAAATSNIQQAVSQPFEFTGTPNMINNMAHLMPTAPTFVPMAAKISGIPGYNHANNTGVPQISGIPGYNHANNTGVPQISGIPGSNHTHTGVPQISGIPVSNHTHTVVPQMYGNPVTGSVSMPIMHATNDILNSQSMYIPANNGWFSVSDIQG